MIDKFDDMNSHVDLYELAFKIALAQKFSKDVGFSPDP